MTSSCTSPEVTELLERFQEKKATVKTRLNNIIDDLFGDLFTDVARISGKYASNQCSFQSESVASDTPSSHGVEEVTPQNLKVLLPGSGSKQSSSEVLETTIRSAQARARELIKDEFYDSDPVSRLSQSSGCSLKPSSSTRSLPDNSADDEMDAPEITLTPIIENVSSSAAALAAVVSSSREMTSILNGGSSGSSSGCSSNDDPHHLQTISTIEKSSHTANNGHSKEDFESEEEFEIEEQSSKPTANGVSNNNNNNNTNNQQPNQEETQEAKSEDEEETKSPEHTNDAIESTITEKSLEELNSLCAGLPYAKEGGRYICKWQDCNQELKSRHNLLLHQRAHLGIRPYRCKWVGCSYNSNQSSAVIRHIRTKHFLLPLTMREQQMKKIEDDRDPKEFLEVVTLNDGAISTATSSAATPESQQCPSSVETPASSADSLQSVAECETPTLGSNNGNYPKMLRSCRQSANSAAAAATPTNGNRGRRSVLQNSSQQPSSAAVQQSQSQSLLMPQQQLQQQQTNGRSSGHKLPPLPLPPPPPPSRPSHDESDEDEYDSEENEFEMIPVHQQMGFQMMQEQMQAAVQQQQQQQQLLQLQQLQQHQAQHQHAAALLHSKSPFDYARKRRLESKIFANAALSNRNRLSGLGSSSLNNNGGSVDSYYGGGSGKVGSAGKRAKYMGGGGGGYGQQTPTTLEPLAAHSASSSSSSSSQRGSGPNQHQYSFCPEEGCNSIFRTTIELDRHLTDVHCRLPQPKGSHLAPGGPPKEPQTYSNLYICKWPKCPFSTVLHSSAINHVRAITRHLPGQHQHHHHHTLPEPQLRILSNNLYTVY